MTKVIETEKFTVRIHGEVNKEKLLGACKKYCEKVNISERKKENEILSAPTEGADGNKRLEQSCILP